MHVYDRLSTLYYAFLFLCCEKKFVRDTFKSARAMFIAAKAKPTSFSNTTEILSNVVYSVWSFLVFASQSLDKGGRT